MPYVDITSSGTTIRITYSHSYSASTNNSTIRITKLQVASTSYTGTYYPSGDIKINNTTVIDMDSYYGTHSVYIGYSNGTFYDISGSLGSLSFGLGNTASVKFECYDVDGVSGSSGKTIWTVNGSKTVNIYKVSYNANGGSGAPGAQAKLNGETLTLSSTKPTRSNTVTNPTGTIQISYNANGGSSTPSAGTGTYTNTKTVSYTFKNWNTASGGTGTAYSSGAAYTANAAATLYAQYNTSTTEVRTTNPSIKTASAITRANGSETGYKVSFNANGGSSTPSAITSTKTIKYSFSNWNTSSDGSGTNYSSGTTYVFSKTATLYAQWTSASSNDAITLPAAIKRSNAVTGAYTITYNANGGTCSKTSEAIDRVSSYAFGGWNTKADGSGTNYNASSSYTPSTATTLYAKWNITTTTNQTTLPIPTRLGYKFLGWAESATASSGVTGSYTPTKTLTLYAIWEALGSVKIRTKDGIHSYVPFIYTKGKWIRAIPFVYKKDKGWVRAGGG